MLLEIQHFTLKEFIQKGQLHRINRRNPVAIMPTLPPFPRTCPSLAIASTPKLEINPLAHFNLWSISRRRQEKPGAARGESDQRPNSFPGCIRLAAKFLRAVKFSRRIRWTFD